MNTKRRKEYPYGVSQFDLSQSFGRPSKKKKRRVQGRYIVLPLVGVFLLYAAYSWLLPGVSGLAQYLPFPNELKALRFQHNGQEVILMPGTQVVLNPRDSLHLLEIQTDGWLHWGTRVSSPDLDIRPVTSGPVTLRDLYPGEEFETPKTLEINVQQWSRPLGKVSFLLQLDAKDWLQKANSASDSGRKVNYLEKALHENPGNVLLKTQLAGLYFDMKKYEAAGKLYREIDALGKSKSILERLLAVYQIQNKTQDALMVYVDLLKLSEEPEIFKEFLDYLQKNLSKDQAVRFLEKVQGDIPQAFHSSVHLFLADLSAQNKNWSKAAAAYEKAIKSGVKDSDVLYNLAVTYQQGDDPDKAVQALERYLERNPADTRSRMQLGGLYEKKGAWSQARQSYEAVLNRNPQNKDALVRLLAVLEKAHDKAGLQSTYEKLAQLQPRNKTVRHNLGVLHYEAQNWEKAAESFEAVASIDPKDVESRKYLLNIYRKVKNDKGEAAVLQSLAVLDPRNPAYQEAIFKSYDEKKDYKGMVAHFRALAQKSPDSLTVHNYILYGLLKSGDTKGAAKQMDNLIRLQPKEKKHLKQAANLYETVGDYPEALKKIEQLLKLDPNDKEAKDDYLRVRMLVLSGKKTS
ncbi:MAG: tetratricopeptide repeat protein [Deltaproteobacteria bacterium]|nr:tetratricopeptide repeat protein [Deltaproteobacteria bacterium]